MVFHVLRTPGDDAEIGEYDEKIRTHVIQILGMASTGSEVTIEPDKQAALPKVQTELTHLPNQISQDSFPD